MSYLGFCHPPPPRRNFVDHVFLKSLSSNELFETCKPSGGLGVWVLQCVYYITSQALKTQICNKGGYGST